MIYTCGNDRDNTLTATFVIVFVWKLDVVDI